MYAGLKLGSDPGEVIAVAEQDNAPFTKFEDYMAWVRSSIETFYLYRPLLAALKERSNNECNATSGDLTLRANYKCPSLNNYYANLV